MAIFDGVYSWTGKREDQYEPIAWFPGAYDLKIIDLRESNNGVSFLKPYLCVFTNTGKGHSISANPEKFAKRLCVDFSLELEKVLWVERAKEDLEKFEIISFIKCGKLSETAFYQVDRRNPTPGELVLIQKNIVVLVGGENN